VNKFLASGDIDAGGLDSVGALIAKIRAQFTSSLQYVLETPQSLYATQAQALTALDQYKQSLKTLAEQVLVETCDADVTLVDKSVAGALKELQTQMIGSGTLYNPDNDVDASTCAMTPTASSANTGTGKLIVSVKRPDGRSGELLLAETMEAICTADGQEGGTAGSETFQVRGEPAVSDALAYNWPGGSGINTQLTSVNAELDNSGGNLLVNSGFETITSNVPDNWAVGSAGVAGTDILEEASIVYASSSKALRLKGQSSPVLSEIAQTFNSSSGTTATLKPQTVYALNCFAKDSGAGLTAGVVAISLVDGSGTVINDDAGTANTVSFAYSDTSGTYAAFNGFFRTPRVLPTTIKLRIKVTTALTDTESVYIDHLALCEATDLYGNGQGPWAAVFSGSTDWIIDDKITVAVTNDRAGGFQEWFDRVFGMRALGLQLPSDTGGAETLADTLISSLESVSDLPQVVATIDPQDSTGATKTSDAVDMTKFQLAMFVLCTGANDDTVDFKIESDDNSGFTSAADVTAKAIVQETAGDDDNKQWVIFVRASELPAGETYVRASVTIGAGTTNLIALVGLGLRPFAGYNTGNDLATVTQIIGS